MSEVSLEFLGKQIERVIQEQADARSERRILMGKVDEQLSGQQDLAVTLRLLNDTLVSINRSIQALDRRISDTRLDLETTIKMELLGFKHGQEDREYKRLQTFEDELVDRLTHLFDERYAPKQPVI